MAKATGDNPEVVDVNGRPVYATIPDLQPRLDEKREALEERLATIEKQNAEAREAFPPAPGVKVQAE